MHLLHQAYIALIVFTFFSSCIFFHELGHMWTALKFGLKVEAFAIGFGPKLWCRTYNGVEYSFRLIPLGGFVRIPELVKQSAVEGESNATPPVEIPTAKRIAVLAAGPLMNVVFAFGIASFLYVVGYPAPADTAEIAGVTAGSTAAKAGVHNGDIIQAIDGKIVANWHEVLTSVALACTNNITITALRGSNQVSYVVSTILDKDLQCKILPLYPPSKLVLRSILKDSPAAKAGLLPDDEIIAINQNPVQSIKEFKAAMGTNSSAVQITYKRFQKLKTINILPVNQRIGVELADVDDRMVITHVTPWAQFREVFDTTYQSFYALAHSTQSQVGLKDLSGPPGIISVIAINSEEDIRLALKFLVLFNLNLAIINLMPLPILDGGHILLALITALTGKKIPDTLLNYIFNIFAIVLISFMVFVSCNDLHRFHWFNLGLATPAPVAAIVSTNATIPTTSAHIPDAQAVDKAFTQINHATFAVGCIFVVTVGITLWFSLHRGTTRK